MTLRDNEAGRPMVKYALTLSFVALALTFLAPDAGAQTPATGSGTVESKPALIYQTLYMTSPAQESDAHEIVTDLRNMLPRAKVYFVPSQGAISMLGTSEDFMLAKQILSDIDRARKAYRLTYTITETDGAQRLGTRRMELIVDSGEKSYVKQGSRVPIVTGTTDAGTANANTQVQYQDVGLNIVASLTGPPDDLQLHTRVEQSNVAEEKPGAGQDPVIHQTTLDETSALEQGKPLVLGSLDIPGSTRHMEIAVSSEPVQ
jgi:type II secretory pathway component GspD/PulD (secretin)